MTRFTLHIPTQYNDGTPVGETVLDIIEDRLVETAGGFTRADGVGAWRGEDGRVYRDPQRIYSVDSESPAVAGKLRQLAGRLARTLGQEAIYMTAQGIETALVEPIEFAETTI